MTDSDSLSKHLLAQLANIVSYENRDSYTFSLMVRVQFYSYAIYEGKRQREKKTDWRCVWMKKKTDNRWFERTFGWLMITRTSADDRTWERKRKKERETLVGTHYAQRHTVPVIFSFSLSFPSLLLSSTQTLHKTTWEDNTHIDTITLIVFCTLMCVYM